MLESLALIRRLPHAGPIILLTVIAGLCESFGLALLIPLVELLRSDSQSPPVAIRFVSGLFAQAGLEMTPTTLLISIVFLIVLSFALIFLHKVVVTRAQFQFTHRARSDLFSALMGAKWNCLSRRSSGAVLSELVQAAERAGAAMHHIGLLLGGVALLVIYAGLSVLISWPLLVVTVALGSLLVAVARPLMRQAARLGKDVTTAERDFTFHTVDQIRGAKLVKVTGVEQAVCDKVIGFGARVARVKIAAQVNGHILNLIMNVGPVLVVAAAIAAGTLIIEVETSLLLVFLVVMTRIAPRVAFVQQILQNHILNLSALREVDRSIAELRQQAEDPNPNGIRFTALHDAIVLDRVCYQYDDVTAPALHDIDLRIEHNSMVALVGASGAGKSTLVELIAGIRVPTRGRVLVDGTDLREFNVASWRRRIGFVTQETFIFDDTLRNNLLFSHPDASPEDLKEALAIAHLREMVEDLSEGLETPLGESGVRFSGGQKQRVALTRALVGRPGLLLLDEATSALDNESELYVQRAIETIAHTMTIVVIAHRLSTVRKADIIYVLDDGRLVESGTYDELLARRGRFAALHDSQFS